MFYLGYCAGLVSRQMQDRIALLKKLRQEIAQYFHDVGRLNMIRLAHERPIDPDPDGELKRIAEGLDRSLANEKDDASPRYLL